MILKKNLVRKFTSLVTVMNEYKNSSNEQYKKDAFADAAIMCSDILSKVESDKYDEAIQKWEQLQRFVNDSVPVSEDFLSRYLPIRQAVINFGMQRR